MFSRYIGMGAAAFFAWVGVGLAMAWGVTFEVDDAAEFNRIIDPAAVLTTNASIDTWMEGPTWIPAVPAENGYLVFCDQNNNRLKKLVPPSTVSDYLVPSVAKTYFNGTLLDGQERLICAEAGIGGQRISMVANGVTTALATTCNGVKFYSPNDVAVKSDGTIWFTDPNYSSGTVKGAAGYPAGYYVYRFDPANGNGTCTAVMTDNLVRTSGTARPNGLCFSPDETRLYVADSDNTADGNRIVVYAVSANNTLSGGRVFASINNGGPDGIKCDVDGRVWSSAGNGVHIFAPDGHVIGRILFNRTANLCFGGPQYRTLYMVGQPLVTSLPVLVSGVQVLKKLKIQSQNGEPILSWPAPSTGWTLQETEHLETPGSWANSGRPMVTANGQNTVSVDTASRAVFFRLRLDPPSSPATAQRSLRKANRR